VYLLRPIESNLLQRCRRLHNSDEPETRGGQPEFTAADAEAVASYICQAPFEKKSDSWQDLAKRAGVVKEYKHERSVLNVQFTEQHIQKRVTAVTEMKTHKAAVKEKHCPALVQMRLQYCNTQLRLRPKKENWRQVLWCNKIHWMTGPKYQKDIKRD
jgi:hypothetical protein